MPSMSQAALGRGAWRSTSCRSSRSVLLARRSLFLERKKLLTHRLPSDAEESVVARVLATLTTLAERRLLAKSKLWELVSQITGFLCHPNIWIREGTSSRLPTGLGRLTNPRQVLLRFSRALQISSSRPTGGASSTRPSSDCFAPTSRRSPSSLCWTTLANRYAFSPR